MIGSESTRPMDVVQLAARLIARRPARPPGRSSITTELPMSGPNNDTCSLLSNQPERRLR